MEIINEEHQTQKLFVISSPRGWCIVRENGFQVSGFFENRSTAVRMAEIYSVLFNAKVITDSLHPQFD